MKEHYNFPELDESEGAGSRVGVFATIGQGFSHTDLSRFQQRQLGQSNDVDNVEGPNYECNTEIGTNCIEGNLDTQWALALAKDADLWFWSTPWSPFSNPFLRFVRDLASREDIPDVNTISYLNSEEEVHPDTMRLFNTEVCKLGLRGVTVIVSSGDDGAPGKVSCYGNGGGKKECKDFKLHPSFPANCPFVTSVGATMGPEKSLEEEEVAAEPGDSTKPWFWWDVTSGGGFSRVFPRPAWQYRVVKKYLFGEHNTAAGDTETWGRGYPDVSFLGYHYEMWLNGENVTVSGTSASAPAFASLISLINGLRVQRGLPKLGFLNPLLYNKIMSHSYNDIVKGKNTCCLGDPHCCDLGYYAAPGWDPVTGLGSPDIGKWLDILLTDFTENKEHKD
jgi:tripeptidyl-peptidase-1